MQTNFESVTLSPRTLPAALRSPGGNGRSDRTSRVSHRPGRELYLAYRTVTREGRFETLVWLALAGSALIVLGLSFQL